MTTTYGNRKSKEEWQEEAFAEEQDFFEEAADVEEDFDDGIEITELVDDALDYYDDNDDLYDDEEDDEQEPEQEQEPLEEKQSKDFLLSKALAANILTMWQLHGFVADRIGKGFPDNTVVDATAEILMRGTNTFLSELSATKVTNPIVIFEKRRKNGDYDDMTNDVYERLRSHTAELGEFWQLKPECDLLTLCLRMIDGR